MNAQQRYIALDSIRGLAAASVVLHHCLLIIPAFLLAASHQSSDDPLMRLLTRTPLHALWAGHEAVILFFVLSGFVLSLPFLNGKTPAFGDYLTKRFSRIYLPYLAATIVGAILATVIDKNQVPGASAWFHQQWAKPISVQTIVEHLLMTGRGTDDINTVTWSLVHEMRISLVFPWIAAYVIKHGAIVNIATILGLSVVSSIFLKLLAPVPVGNLLVTISIISWFLFGAVLAKYRGDLLRFVTYVGGRHKTVLYGLALIMYTLTWTIPSLGLPGETVIHNWSTAMGSGLMILLASDAGSASWLNHPLSVWLGQISYSLYLIHAIVLVATVSLLYKLFPLGMLIACLPVLSLLAAAGFNRFVDQPFVRIGKALSAKSSTRTGVSPN